MITQPLSAKTQYSSNILGFNIDGDRVLIVYGNLSGMVSERITFPAPAQESFQALLEQISIQADRLLILTKAQHLPLPDRVSISVSGNYDQLTGLVNTARDFPEWKSEPIKSQVGLRFNLPVFIEQKANAGCLAELMFGSGAETSNLVFISVSPVVRVGIVVEGRLLHFPGGNGGSIGRMRINEEGPAALGQAGSLDGYASAAGMAELALLRQPSHWDTDVDAYRVIQAALQGDPFADEIILEVAAYLGKGLTPLIHLLRPEKIVIGYPMANLGEKLIIPLKEAVVRESGLGGSQLPQLVASQLGARLPELQALAPAIYAARSSSLTKN